MKRSAAIAAVVAAAVIGACGPRGPAVRPEAQALQIRCAVDEAAVFIDDRFVGTAADVRRRELPILPGFHRIEVRAERYFPRYAEVEIPPGGRAALDITLRPRPEVP